MAGALRRILGGILLARSGYLPTFTPAEIALVSAPAVVSALR
jgi:hypothetical protein